MELTELTRRQTLIQHSPIGKKNQKKVSEKQSNITKKSNGEITQKKISKKKVRSMHIYILI